MQAETKILAISTLYSSSESLLPEVDVDDDDEGRRLKQTK